MADPKWKDATSYSRSEPWPRQPENARTWQLDGPRRLRVIVTRRIGDPGRWYLDCRELGLDQPLEATALVAAQTGAVALCIALLTEMQRELREAYPGTPERKPRSKR